MQPSPGAELPQIPSERPFFPVAEAAVRAFCCRPGCVPKELPLRCGRPPRERGVTVRRGTRPRHEAGDRADDLRHRAARQDRGSFEHCSTLPSNSKQTMSGAGKDLSLLECTRATRAMLIAAVPPGPIVWALGPPPDLVPAPRRHRPGMNPFPRISLPR